MSQSAARFDADTDSGHSKLSRPVGLRASHRVGCMLGFFRSVLRWIDWRLAVCSPCTMLIRLTRTSLTLIPPPSPSPKRPPGVSSAGSAPEPLVSKQQCCGEAASAANHSDRCIDEWIGMKRRPEAVRRRTGWGFLGMIGSPLSPRISTCTCFVWFLWWSDMVSRRIGSDLIYDSGCRHEIYTRICGVYIVKASKVKCVVKQTRHISARNGAKIDWKEWTKTMRRQRCQR